MARRLSQPFCRAPLQVFDDESNLGPAEIAALEERVNRSKQAARSTQKLEAIARLKKPAAAELLKQAQRQSVEERFELTTKLVAQLSAGKRLELLEQLTSSSRHGSRGNALARMRNAK